MRTAVALALIALFLMLSLTSRVAGMYTYWWFGVFRPQDWVWADLSAFRLPLVAALVFVIPSLFSRKIPRFNNPIAILMLSYCVLAAVASFLNGCDVSGFKIKTLSVMDLFVLVYIALLSAEVIEKRKTMFGLIFIIAVSLAVYSGKGGISALITGASYYNSTQLKGFLSGSNAYALGTAMILYFMIFSFQEVGSLEKQGENYNRYLLWGMKLMLLISIVGSIYNIIATQSRGSFVAVVVSLFVWVFLNKKNTKLILISSLLFLAALTIVPLPEGFEERIEGVFVDHEDLDKSATSRPHFWMTAVSIANDHPLGVGPGCYPYYYNFYDQSNGLYGVFRSVHSSHFQILADTGYPGIVIWVLLLFLSLKKLWRIRAAAESLEGSRKIFYFNLANALIASLVAFIIGGSFYEFGYNDITWLIFGLVIAMEKLLDNEKRSTENCLKSEA